MRGSSLAYAIQHTDTGPNRYQIVHVPTGTVAYRGRTRAEADLALVEMTTQGDHLATPMTDAELDAHFARSRTAGEW